MTQVFHKTKLIVCDKCTMAKKGCVEALDTKHQGIRNRNRLMGGMKMLLAGDFRQTSSVV